MRPKSLKRSHSQYAELPEVASNGDAGSMVETSPSADLSLDRDNKLLHFATPSFNYALLDYSYRRVPVSLTAQLHGMFFLAESLWAGSEDVLYAPREVTCYRRNLFSISGHVQLPRTLRYILTDQGEQVAIVSQQLELSATESVEHNPVKIISVPWKTPVGAGPIPEDKSEKEPTPISLDLSAGADIDRDIATIPVSWKRLQFRIATANNGRRKELQQHFTVKLRLTATLSNGKRASLCETTSGPMIVRGRSPRNFRAKREVPVGNGSLSSRKAPASARSPSADVAMQTSPSNVQSAASSIMPDSLLSSEYLDFKLPSEYQSGALLSGLPATSPITNDYARRHSPHASQLPVVRSVPTSTQLSSPSARSSRKVTPEASSLGTPIMPSNKRPRVTSYPPATNSASASTSAISWIDACPPSSQPPTSMSQMYGSQQQGFPLTSAPSHDWAADPFEFAVRSQALPLNMSYAYA